MPWRLIGFICVFIVFLIFIGFNLGEDFQCNINFGFVKLENVPVFYTIFVSFALGVLVTLPVVISGLKKRKNNKGIDLNDLNGPITEGKNMKTGNLSQAEIDAKLAKIYDEPPPSYSGGKYFDKKKKK